MAEVDDEEEAAIENMDDGVDQLDEASAKACVIQLQQEANRKNDYQARLIRKLQKLDADLAQRREEVEGLQRTLELERSKQTKQTENDRRERHQKSQLQAERIRDQLSEVLYQKPKDNDPKATFDLPTVLVSFIKENDSIRYNLTFRLDNETTVEQLRSEACKYWGVDMNDYILMTMGNSKCHTHLKVKECFKHGEIAQLRLGRRQCDNIEVTQAELKSIQPKDKKTRKADKDSARFNKEGVDRVQKFGENYTSYLKQLGGVYFMLKLRDQKPSEHAAKIKLRDFILFIALALLTFGIYVQRRPAGQAYWYQQGLVDSFMTETAVNGTTVPSFANISTIDEVWDWLDHTLPMVIWGSPNTKSVRDYNAFPGHFAIRVQNVKQGDLTEFCVESNRQFVKTLKGARCQPESTSDGDSVETSDIPNLTSYWDYVNTVNLTDPEIRGPSLPSKWRSVEENEKRGIGTLTGSVRTYDASGYMVDYRSDIPEPAGQLFKYSDDMKELRRLQWISTHTRVVVLEFSSYNYHYDLWASCLFMLEIPPGGKVYPTYKVSPFRPSLMEIPSEVTEIYCDVIRCLMGAYILIFIGIAERRHKTKNHKAGANYYATLNGFVDVSMSALIFAATIMRFVLFSSSAREFWSILNAYDKGFYSTELLADQYAATFKLEGCIFILIMLRLISLFRLSPMVYLLWHTIGIALKSFLYLCVMFLPAVIGFAFLAMQVWGLHLERFETLPRTLMQIYMFFSGSAGIVQLLEISTVWSAIFCTFFYVVIKFLLLNTFVALMVDAYYVVRLTCNMPRQENQSTRKWFFQWAFPSILNSMIQNMFPQGQAEGT